ncbi:MAG: glycine cleavage system protein H [Syntrophobacteraceae bacterium]|jgi:glycine cleavage system H lipoate-binding protein
MKILAHLLEARQAEYIIALLGLFGFIVFWRVLNGPGIETEALRDLVRRSAERIAGFLVPPDVMFHPGHAWARAEDLDTVTVGMDDFAAKLLGSADSISLPKPGSRVKQGALGWGFKTDCRVIHMLSPVEGEVLAVNDAVADSLAAAFEDPYGKGWLFKVRSKNLTSNLKNMIPSGMVGEWFESIRQTLASKSLAPTSAPLYADGGEPVPGFAKAIDPERWDDLAREFFLTK